MWGNLKFRSAGLAAGLIAFGVASATQVIGIYVDGKRRDGRFPPQLQNGRTLMFLRDTFDALGAAVKWDPAEKKITAWLAEDEIEVWIGAGNAVVNGERVALDQPAILDPASGSTLVPLRFIGESLGAEIKYTGSSNRVDINTRAIPYYTEKAPFKVGDPVEILITGKYVWQKGTVKKVTEFKDNMDSYVVEYKEGPPNNRTMTPSLRRSHVRKPRG